MKPAHLRSSQGNRCGHDPKRPRIDLGWPGQEDAQGGPSLTIEMAARWFHQPQNSPLFRGPGRQIRSERREACLAILSVLLKYLDSSSLRVGLSTAGGDFIGLGLKILAQESGLGMRRCERAAAQLKAAGLITSTESTRLTLPFIGPKHTSLRVVRLINPDFLKSLLVDQQWPTQNPIGADAGELP